MSPPYLSYASPYYHTSLHLYTCLVFPRASFLALAFIECIHLVIPYPPLLNNYICTCILHLICHIVIFHIIILKERTPFLNVISSHSLFYIFGLSFNSKHIFRDRGRNQSWIAWSMCESMTQKNVSWQNRHLLQSRTRKINPRLQERPAK